MGVDMNVMTKEPSIIDRNSEDVEFILQIEDMQSAVSHDPDCIEPYSLAPRKRKRTPLNTLFDNYADKSGFKRVKVTENETNGYDYNSCSTTIYDEDDLKDFIGKNAKVIIHNSGDKRTFESSLSKINSDEEEFFKVITNELESLWVKYDKPIEEMHTYWMEANWDMDDLKKVLSGHTQKWTTLEDLAVQSDPGTQEFQWVETFKGQEEILKRRKFFELE